MPKIGFVSLGCPKALVDSERILTRLRGEGYETSPTYEGADAVRGFWERLFRGDRSLMKVIIQP